MPKMTEDRQQKASNQQQIFTESHRGNGSRFSVPGLCGECGLELGV